MYLIKFSIMFGCILWGNILLDLCTNFLLLFSVLCKMDYGVPIMSDVGTHENVVVCGPALFVFAADIITDSSFLSLSVESYFKLSMLYEN